MRDDLLGQVSNLRIHQPPNPVSTFSVSVCISSVRGRGLPERRPESCPKGPPPRPKGVSSSILEPHIHQPTNRLPFPSVWKHRKIKLPQIWFAELCMQSNHGLKDIFIRSILQCTHVRLHKAQPSQPACCGVRSYLDVVQTLKK
jgi:hypothetical protein